MTCDTALDIVDAEGLVEISAERLTAAKAHARQCSRCRHEFEVAGGVVAGISGLGEPILARDFSGDIMASIRSRAAERESRSAEARASWRSFAWADGAVVGTLLLALMLGSRVIAGENWLAFQLGLVRGVSMDVAGLLQMPSSFWSVAVALALVVFVLLAPLRSAAPRRS
jgi:hypothetical protein